MTAPTIVLPAPPNGARFWSIVTLAQHLCVPPAVVDTQLDSGSDGGVDESPDIHSIRLGYSYRAADGEHLRDCFLTDEAADRIAAALPAGLLARRIAAGHPAGTALLGYDQIADLALHIVEHLGGER